MWTTKAIWLRRGANVEKKALDRLWLKNDVAARASSENDHEEK